MKLLDERLDESPGGELTFAEWFARWDSGPRAPIVDRLSLSRTGFGPKSVCIPSRDMAKSRGISRETLDHLGLGMVVLPGAIVITSAIDLPHFDDWRGTSRAVAECFCGERTGATDFRRCRGGGVSRRRR